MAPVRIATPAWDAEATVVPTAAQGPAAQDTPSRSADVDPNGTGTHEAPPLAELSTTPWPTRPPPRTVDVVPTAVQEVRVLLIALEVQSMPWSAPVPAGTGWRVHVVPPSEVAAITPTTWSTSTDCDAVAQQEPPSMQDNPVAADATGGRAPPAPQILGDDGIKVVTRPATTPRAVHRPPVRQSTAVTSVVPAGTVWSTHVAPPLAVVRTAPGPAPVSPTWPTAVHERVEAQATADR
jgi:hypothetical protein